MAQCIQLIKIKLFFKLLFNYISAPGEQEQEEQEVEEEFPNACYPYWVTRVRKRASGRVGVGNYLNVRTMLL